MRRQLLATLLLLLGACARPIEPPPSIPRLPKDSEPRRVSLRLLVRGELARRAATAVSEPYVKVEVASLDEALTRVASAAAPPTSIGEASEALELARRAYRKLAFEKALEQLNRAQELLVPHARTTEHFALLGRVSLRRGLNLLALKQRDAASQALRWALALGQVPATPGQFSPEIEALLDELRANKPPSGSLSFVAPAGARVEVDGASRGVAPVTISLAPGLHHLRLTKLGSRSRGLLQLVAPGKVDRVALSLEPKPQAAELAGQLLDDQLTDALAAEHFATVMPLLLARALPGEKAALITRGGRVELLWLGSSRDVKPRACQGPSATSCVAEGLYLFAVGEPPPGHQKKPRQVASKPLYKRWWFWTALSVVAAGAGVTAAVVATRPEAGTNVEIVSKP